MIFSPLLAAFGIFQAPAPTAIFILCLLVSAAVLLFYAKRHPHPRFRPKLGELVLVGMIFFGISVGLTAMTSGLFEQQVLDAAQKKAKETRRTVRKGGGGGAQNPGEETEQGADTDFFKDEPPPFMEEGE